MDPIIACDHSDELIKSSDISVFDMDIADHFVVEFYLNISKPSHLVKTVIKRNIESIDMSEFKNDWQNCNISDSNSSLQSVVNKYNTQIAAVLNKHAPEQSKTVVVRPNTQWYNANLRRAKVVRRRLERKMIKSGSEHARKAFREQCRLVNKL